MSGVVGVVGMKERASGVPHASSLEDVQLLYSKSRVGFFRTPMLLLCARAAARLPPPPCWESSSSSARRTLSHATVTMAAAAAPEKGPGIFTYQWPRPGFTVDVAVLAPPSTSSTGGVHLLLIQRGQPPAAGRWALPGGFVEPDEHLDAAAARELKEETGLDLGRGGGGGTLRQVRAFGGPDRDPRGWTVTVAYAAVLPRLGSPLPVKGGDDAAAAKWWPLKALPELAFDHAAIIACVCRSVAGEEAGEEAGWGGELVAGAEALEAREWVPTRD